MLQQQEEGEGQRIK